MKIIYKYTLQINRKEIRDYNFCTINISTKTSQELINSIYKLAVKTTLKNPCRTIVINLYHKPESRLISSNVTNINTSSNMDKHLIKHGIFISMIQI